MNSRLLLVVSMLGMTLCGLLLITDRGDAMHLRASTRRWLACAFGIEGARIALLQADLRGVSVPLWMGIRLGSAAVTSLVVYALFHLWVLAGLTLLASYHLTAWALEIRRRRVQVDRHRALLDAVRYGAAVMSRAGNVSQMLAALAEHGPWQVRRLFAGVIDRVQASRGETSLAEAIRETQRQLADPMFDDIALAISLHAQRGSRLVPALEALAADWDHTLALQREGKALRAGVEASVLILTFLPFVFLLFLQLASPALLAPFHSPLGEVIFGAALVWMALGYRILQGMAAPPTEERVSFSLEAS